MGGGGAYILTEPNSKFVNSSFSPLTIRIKKEKAEVKPMAIRSQPKLEMIVNQLDSAKMEPKITLNDQKIKSNIFLVAASFKTWEKAEVGLLELKSKGFEKVEILPKKADESFYRISIGQLETMNEAYQEANVIKKSKGIDIWVYNRH